MTFSSIRVQRYKKPAVKFLLLFKGGVPLTVTVKTAPKGYSAFTVRGEVV
jgi:hypothetical protein